MQYQEGENMMWYLITNKAKIMLTFLTERRMKTLMTSVLCRCISIAQHY